VLYRWYSCGDAERARLLDAAGATTDELPVIVTTDGTALRGPE
jgi:thioredoxin reductase (NADPH)